MSTQDYLTRYFQQLGKVLAAIIELRKLDNNQQALEIIDQTLTTWFGEKKNMLENIEIENPIQQLLNKPSIGFEQERAIAELLFQRSLINKALKKFENSRIDAQRALEIFKRIDQESGQFSIEIQEQIAVLDQIVNNAN